MYSVYVIIATYNGAEWLEKCLGSLRNSGVPLVPVVIDNGSTDSSLSIIKNQFPEVLLLDNRKNLGFGKANNTGIAYAMRNGADFVFLLNQDAWIFPDTIGKLIEISNAHPEMAIISPMHLDSTEQALESNFARWISPEKCAGIPENILTTTEPLQDVYSASFVNAALWLLPRKTIKTIGVFDPLFHHYGEDVDYSNRVNYHEKKTGICPGVYGVHDKKVQPTLKEAEDLDQPNKKKDTAYLILLKNINRSFGGAIVQFGNMFLKRLLNRLRKAKFKELLTETAVGLMIILKLKKIYMHRQVSKKMGSNFLPENGTIHASSVNAMNTVEKILN